MKILVLQLARFGDIYLTWPALRALRRKFPNAQIDLMVRQRFAGATQGLGENIGIKVFDTAQILAPVLTGAAVDVELESFNNVDLFLQPLIAENYDRIINLSFSPLSSYITSILASETCTVSGYTRHADGHLNIPDDSSAYFYAQVGIDKKNRFHLTQIFASICDVDLEAQDWGYQGEWPAVAQQPQGSYLVYHVGASDLNKTYSSFKVSAALKWIQREWSGQVVLIGSGNELPIANQILGGSGLNNVTNLVGKTGLQELFTLIKNAKLMLGADSAPIHIASHTGTPVLNLSFSNVNFWETGPCSAKSRVLWAESSEELPSDRVAREALQMLKGEDIQIEKRTDYVWTRDSLTGPWQGACELGQGFSWRLIEALYTGAPFPALESKNAELGIRRLSEITQVALAEMTKSEQISEVSLQILNQIDALFVEIPQLVTELQPVVDWFQTERVRIAPGTPVEVLHKTIEVFERMKEVLAVYQEPSSLGELKEQGVLLCHNLAGALNEWNLAEASSQLNEFLEVCRRLASVSPKVGDSDLMWSKVLSDVQSGFEKKEFLRVADFIQYEISPALENWVS